MATSNKNLSSGKPTNLTNSETFRIGIVVSEWNEEVTEALYSGAVSTLLQAGVIKDNIERKDVPGSFELPLGAQWLASRTDIDAVICIGCIIQGETKHFDFICEACAHGITEVGLKFNKPVAFGVLTTDNMKQAMDRAGGKFGNKGDEAASTILKMLNF
ncbi:MAG: 6,7-dimethyl-8-ribityllumazine synthase [Cyclobacteriaceae bacterium]|nr:6,7-dimethyl-8-ribityllumazine synthase [Cyclobacteriaceae bacterium SS2]